jgi:hypothetical protein
MDAFRAEHQAIFDVGESIWHARDVDRDDDTGVVGTEEEVLTSQRGVYRLVCANTSVSSCV